MLDFLKQTLAEAEREKFSLRTWGEMSWIARTKMPLERIMEYESRVNEIFPSADCTMVCVYDLAHTPSAILSDILATHPVAIMNGRMRPNPYYVAPADYLRMIQH